MKNTLIIVRDWKTRRVYIVDLEKEDMINEEIILNVAAQIYEIPNKMLSQ